MKRQTKRDIDKLSFSMRMDLNSENSRIVKLTDQIFKDVMPYSNMDKRRKKRLYQHLKLILLNLIGIHRRPDKKYLPYSSNNNNPIYKASNNPYNPEKIRRSDLANAVNLLKKRNYIGKMNHYYDPKTQYGYSARLYLKDKLTNLFKAYGVRTKMIGYAKSATLVFKKTRKDRRGRRKLLFYNPSAQRTSHRIKQLDRYNILLQSSKITHTSAKISCYPLRLYRSFTQDWEHGGRFYGGFWIHLNEQERKGIKINGNKVVELDYKSFHPRMLYDIEQVTFDGDEIYQVSGLNEGLVKAALLILINAKTYHSAIQAINEKVKETTKKKDRITSPKGYDVSDVLRLIETAHDPIKKYFYSDKGIKLQFIDSRITNRILNYFTKCKILVLPIHDSHLIEQQYELLLREQMIKAYQKVMKSEFKLRSCKPIIEKK